MSKKIEVGEVVEITAISKMSSWHGDRKKFIGTHRKLTWIRTISDNKNWKMVDFKPIGKKKEAGSYSPDCIFGVKIRRIKK